MTASTLTYRDQALAELETLPEEYLPFVVQLMRTFRAGLTAAAQSTTAELLAAEAEISTQRAADLLHVSRPFLLDLLEQKQIPSRRVGSQLSVRLADVLAYKQSTDAQRMAALDELTRMSQELGLGYD